MFSAILKSWNTCYSETFEKSVWLKRLFDGDLSLSHYKGLLLETYHHAGLNPQIQAFTTMYMNRNFHKIQKMFFKHAISEIGHDILALNDLVALGENEKAIRLTHPMPETIAYNAYVIYKIQFDNPLSYLGYLFHLEYLATQKGHSYMESLRSMGVPDKAMGFLEEHTTVDVAHNKLMEEYINTLVTDSDSLEVVSIAIRDSCQLHLNMIEASFKNGEKIYSERRGTAP